VKYGRQVAILISSVAACSATTPGPYAGQCRLIDNVAERAVPHPEQRGEALRFLELIALGQAKDVTRTTEALLGRTSGPLQDEEYRAPSVRGCALRALGRTGLPQALEFLGRLKQGDFADDSSQQVWPEAHIALHEARLNAIQDADAQVEFLARIVSEQVTGTTAYWASNQLCDRGASQSLPAIRESLRRNWSGSYGENEVRFCEARVQVIRSNPDRVKALAAVLTTWGSEDMRLLRWAVDQLDGLATPAADAEVDRFLAKAEALPDGDTRKQTLASMRQQVREERRSRATAER